MCFREMRLSHMVKSTESSALCFVIPAFKRFLVFFLNSRGVARAIFLDFATVDVWFFRPKVGRTCYCRGPYFDGVTYQPIQSVFYVGGGVARAIFLDFATVDVWFFMPRRGLTCYYRDPNFDLVTNEPINQSMVNNSDIFIFWWNVHFMSICLFY